MPQDDGILVYGRQETPRRCDACHDQTCAAKFERGKEARQGFWSTTQEAQLLEVWGDAGSRLQEGAEVEWTLLLRPFRAPLLH